MKKLLIYYNFIVATTFVLLALFNAHTVPELVTGALFSPLLIYFVLLILPHKNHAARIEKEPIIAQKIVIDQPPSLKMPQFDLDRRLFLKLIASGGISLFFFAIFTRKAEAAFFGSAPGPGTISLKDTTGAKIDPAEKHPTDGYQITELDDNTPTYYGYINKNGAWFIRKEDATGSYRYTKGSSSFATNWTNRASLSYDYFDAVF